MKPECPHCGLPALKSSSTGRLHYYCGNAHCHVFAFFPADVGAEDLAALKEREVAKTRRFCAQG